MLSPRLRAPIPSLALPSDCPIVIDAKNKEELHPEMQANIKAFEKELKCPICFEYVDDAVAPPCHHLFCRQCIVHAIERKSTCPVCGVAIQRGHRSLEAQPWTNEVISQYSHALQELFRDRDTDFLFSQVPTSGFAAFKPPVPSPNRTKFLPAAISQPLVSGAIPPPPVPTKSLAGKKQLGVRRPLTTAAAAVSSPSSVAAAPVKVADESKPQASHASLGQKRERDGEVKQVTFAATECPRPLPPRHTAAASAPRAALFAAAKPDSCCIPPAAPVASVLNFTPPAASPQPSTNSSAGAPPKKIPAQSTQRTYGKVHRPPAPALQPAAVLPPSTSRPQPVLESPGKPAPHEQQHALTNTPGKDNATAATAAAAITPNTEPRASRCRGSGTALIAQSAA